ncbi:MULTISPECIES: metallophosphoesterase [Kitasatospora]|uniref:Putative phosphodiesterase n=1 Tax=Kitasatospora setae (strain ATCC 33774 / DSM 43861 / JCM 3304 / KCC A-0304 / NBRC 14216 / KM-6054) TaxID=452652 RepID=E4N4Q7_KITSK|nr:MULTISPECIES: metallophosphoesterase [Kitasatospora]BAJ26188.1 putative phosphodiesterase [Kitasatospora setae KM-6054]
MKIAVVVLGALAALGVLGAAHWYIWRRMVRDVSRPGGRYRRIGTALAIALPVCMLLAAVGGRAFPLAVERWFAWPGYLWMAVSIYLLFALLAGEAVRPLLRRLRRAPATATAAVPAAESVTVPPSLSPSPSPSPSSSPSPLAPAGPAARPDADAARRLFVSRVVAGGAAAVAVGVVGNGMYGVLRGPRLKQVTVPLAKLPRAAHGYRIAVVSDIHLGPILGTAHTRRIVDTINAAQPDLITVVGDLVDGTVPELGPAARPLADLRAKDGAYFVTGNHEYFSGAAPWVEFVRELGVHPLENDRVELPWFDLAGVNDIAGTAQGQGPDYDRALGDRDRARAAVLMAHQPVTVHDSVRHGVDLQLSGHTHGGQLWPGNYLAELANPTVAGLERYGDTQLYVTRGAGAWGPPVRVGAPSDITIVTLASLQA